MCLKVSLSSIILVRKWWSAKSKPDKLKLQLTGQDTHHLYHSCYTDTHLIYLNQFECKLSIYTDDSNSSLKARMPTLHWDILNVVAGDTEALMV